MTQQRKKSGSKKSSDKKAATPSGASTSKQAAAIRKKPGHTAPAGKIAAGKTPAASASRPAANPAAKQSNSAAVNLAPQAAPPLTVLNLAVRWRDLDAFNHVNNANFLTYIEEARLHWLMALKGVWYDDNVAPVVAAVHMNYRRPIEWPETVSVELSVERAGDSSITLAHRIVSARDSGVLYADGNAVMVWIDRRSGKPAQLPDVIRRSCG